jgi:hypothetical protein
MKAFQQDDDNGPVGFIFLEMSRSLFHLLASDINFHFLVTILGNLRFDCGLHQLISRFMFLQLIVLQYLAPMLCSYKPVQGSLAIKYIARMVVGNVENQ